MTNFFLVSFRGDCSLPCTVLWTDEQQVNVLRTIFSQFPPCCLFFRARQTIISFESHSLCGVTQGQLLATSSSPIPFFALFLLSEERVEEEEGTRKYKGKGSGKKEQEDEKGAEEG